jgi:hypothetical protein
MIESLRSSMEGAHQGDMCGQPKMLYGSLSSSAAENDHPQFWQGINPLLGIGNGAHDIARGCVAIFINSAYAVGDHVPKHHLLPG